eukprot:GHVU01169559.1.p2 GENE.GHVU01169559.1~~GHVU01169559.1.p2  ORF type:complete len:185 (+),score=38.93 GHVU01169559.1:362-916(+)
MDARWLVYIDYRRICVVCMYISSIASSIIVGPAGYLGYTKNMTGSQFFLYERTADFNRLMGKFMYVHDPTRTEPDKVEVYRKGEEMEFISDFKDVMQIDGWIREKSFPYFGPINGENFQKYTERAKEMVWFAGSKAQYEECRPAMVDTAKVNSNFSFVWLDTDQYSGHAERKSEEDRNDVNLNQ